MERNYVTVTVCIWRWRRAAIFSFGCNIGTSGHRRQRAIFDCRQSCIWTPHHWSRVSRINRHKTWARFLHFHLGVSVGRIFSWGGQGTSSPKWSFWLISPIKHLHFGGAVGAAHFVGVARGHVCPNWLFGFSPIKHLHFGGSSGGCIFCWGGQGTRLPKWSFWFNSPTTGCSTNTLVSFWCHLPKHF